MKITKHYIAAALAIALAAGVSSCDKVKALMGSDEKSENSATTADTLHVAMTSDTDAYPARKQGEVFLDSIAKCNDVTALGAGIYYKVLTEGSGEKPNAESTVKVNYEGTLVDGTVFDSSYARMEPATFPVNAVIPGWQYILKEMPVGSTWEAYIPYYYAYGASGTPGIPPYSALVFKIELLEIVQ